jgi:hypothetical protein
VKLAIGIGVGSLLAVGCALDDGPVGQWGGTIDTLPSGQVVVRNPAQPLLATDDAWRLVEDLRIGTVDGTGPDLFARVTAMELDGMGRIWVLEGQAREIRVFAPDGRHVRTVGREGGGPGELAEPVHLALGPDGSMWVTDPGNNRVSVFDTSGTYLEGKYIPGGPLIMPWRGGVDDRGWYHGVVTLPRDQGWTWGLVRYDRSFTVVDTLPAPRDPVVRERFERQAPGGWTIFARIPFTGGLAWGLAPSGTIWGMLTDEYRLFALTPAGDTVRTILRDFTPLPVTGADEAHAREQLAGFIAAGGTVDWSLIPSTKPATEGMVFDSDGFIWVRPVTTPEETGRRFDVFDPDGRFLVTVRADVSMASFPEPIIRQGFVYAVTEDELGVQFVVRVRIERPAR